MDNAHEGPGCFRKPCFSAGLSDHELTVSVGELGKDVGDDAARPHPHFRAARGEGEEFRTLGFVREFLSDLGFQLETRDDDPRYYVPYLVHGFREPED